MRIIQRRNRVECTSYHRMFDYVDEPGRGFMFDCDEQGNLLPEVTELCRKNYETCLTGTVGGRPIRNMGISVFRHSYTEPAVGICDRCGAEVVLHGFTNTCDCGADYNMSGQLLAPRSQWGEETGESLADILSIDSRSPKDLLKD